MDTAKLEEETIIRFGHDDQRKTLIEELAELTTAIYHSYKWGNSDNNLYEKVTDCLKILSQIDIIFKTAPRRDEEYNPLWAKDISLFEQIIYYAGRLQAALIIYPEHVSGGLSIRELLIQLRETLNAFVKDVGTDTANNWMDKKNDQIWGWLLTDTNK